MICPESKSTSVQKNLKYWLALIFIHNVGPITVNRILAAYKDPEDVFRATEQDLMHYSGLPRYRARLITSFNDWKRVDTEYEKIIKNNILIITKRDESYPEALKELDNAPPFLYVKGDFQESDKFALAIVGSRNATDYGITVTERMASSLASSGFTIVSGLARGIDTAAHRSALRAKGRTIAVLGCGIDVPYPYENKHLLKNIPLNGAVISEFPTGTRPIRENFPRRNRIISALSLGVLVVEASEKSGSLITARHAVNQGKEVFAVPGNILNNNSKGTHALIKEGARIVDNPDDIIEELGPLLKGLLRQRQRSLPELSEAEKELLSFLSREPKHVEVIIRESKMTASSIMTHLLSLELKGVVKQWDGNKFSTF
jgi:DNA processing protein